MQAKEIIDTAVVEHPEQDCSEFQEHLRAFQESHCEDPGVDLVADYEEAKQDFMCPIELRALELQHETTQHFANKEFSDVLVIVTGGTLTMVDTPQGYQPQQGLAQRLKLYKTFYDKEVSEQEGADVNTLITPESPFKTRIRFKVHEFEDLIDSSCVDLQDQIHMASVIEQNYRDFDGFVIIHGTDTMAYTASTLSFMLENLNKTVVVTGSQIPISQLRSDAVDNLLGALMVAGPFQIPEVVIYFDNKILRGNRSTKASSSKMEAFESPNMPPLAIFDVNLAVEWHRILKHNKGTFKVFREMNTNIAQITISPLFTNWRALAHLFQSSDAVILSGYGMGNLPINNSVLMDTIRKAVEDGVLVVVSTQCFHGTVSDIYATGKFLTEMGCLLAQDMTLECLFAKLSYLIGKGYSTDRVKLLMKASLRGELTSAAAVEEKFEFTNNDMVLGVANYLNTNDHDDIQHIKKSLSPVLLNSVASTGNLELLKKLHKEGCDLDSIDYLGRGILHIIASTPEREEIARYLCQQNVNLDLLDNKARSALYLAIEADNFSIAKILADNGASLVADSGRLAKMLCMVGFDNDIDKLRFLIKCDCDLQQADYDKRTIGHLAAAEGHIQILELLVRSSKFNFELTDRWGNKVLDELRDLDEKRRIEALIQQRSMRQATKQEAIANRQRALSDEIMGGAAAISVPGTNSNESQTASSLSVKEKTNSAGSAGSQD